MTGVAKGKVSCLIASTETNLVKAENLDAHNTVQFKVRDFFWFTV